MHALAPPAGANLAGGWDPEKVDLVLEGGGVKGIALVGAISVLSERGVPIHRVAGSSAGAIVGSLVAAGMKVETMKDVVDKIPYASFKDPTFLNHFGFVGEGASFLFERGLYKGSAFETWVRKQPRSSTLQCGA